MANNLIKVLRVIFLITTIFCSIQKSLSNPATKKNPYVPPHRLPAVQSFMKFRCTKPQQRAYHLKDLMDSQNLLHSQDAPSHPVYLVVHRCDGHSGCCSSDQLVCMPAEGSIYFEELDIQISSVDTKRNNSRIRISVEQHHNCSCEDSNSTKREALESLKPRIALVS